MGANELPFPVRHELLPVEHRFTDVAGAHVLYVDEGVGGTILLLHGNPAWSFLYRKIIVGLKREFRCTAEEFGGWAASAHHWFDHHAVGGLIVPRKRRVLVRRSDGRSRRHPVLVWIDVHDVSRVSADAQPDS